jgi:hypothetical protein
MSFSNPKILGIALGVVYGISIRLLFELEQLKEIGALVTISPQYQVSMKLSHHQKKAKAYSNCRLLYEMTPTLVFIQGSGES